MIKMNQNRVHIIVPIYNPPTEFFRVCLRSIARQVHTNFMCIMVDDGSMPETATLCDEIVAQDTRFSIIHKKNEGTAFARRDGVLAALADGAEYISFIDSDDTVEPEYLSMMLGSLLETNADVCFCGVNEVKDGKTTIPTWSPSESGTSEDRSGMAASVLGYPHKKFGIRFAVWAGIFRMSLFNGVDWDFNNKKIGEDKRLSIQLMLNVRKASYLRNCLYNYVLHPVGVSKATPCAQRLRLSVECQYAVADLVKSRFPECNFTQDMAFDELRFSLGLLCNLLDSGTDEPSFQDDADEYMRHILHAAGIPGVLRRFRLRVRLIVWILKTVGFPTYRILRKAIKAVKLKPLHKPANHKEAE